MSLTIKLHTIASHNTKISRRVRPRFLRPIHHSNFNDIGTVIDHKMSVSPSSNYPALIVKSSLIDPDGGSLVDLVIPTSERDLKASEAELMPKVKLTKIDLEWVQVISEGWASPSRGFMREDEYLQSLHFNCIRMKDGSLVNMSLPIVLAIDDDAKERIGESNDVSLIGPDGDLIGILRRLVEIYKWLLIFDASLVALHFLKSHENRR